MLDTSAVWEGRNLAVKDTNGTSDPYCIYGYVDGNRRWIDNDENITEPQRSLVVEKTLNPKWLTKDKVLYVPSSVHSYYSLTLPCALAQ